MKRGKRVPPDSTGKDLPSKRRVRITATVSPDLAAWVQARIGPGKPFKNRSRAIEAGLSVLRDLEEGRPPRLPERAARVGWPPASPGTRGPWATGGVRGRNAEYPGDDGV